MQDQSNTNDKQDSNKLALGPQPKKRRLDLLSSETLDPQETLLQQKESEYQTLLSQQKSCFDTQLKEQQRLTNRANTDSANLSERVSQLIKENTKLAQENAEYKRKLHELQKQYQMQQTQYNIKLAQNNESNNKIYEKNQEIAILKTTVEEYNKHIDLIKLMNSKSFVFDKIAIHSPQISIESALPRFYNTLSNAVIFAKLNKAHFRSATTDNETCAKMLDDLLPYIIETIKRMNTFENMFSGTTTTPLNFPNAHNQAIKAASILSGIEHLLTRSATQLQKLYTNHKECRFDDYNASVLRKLFVRAQNICCHSIAIKELSTPSLSS